MTTTELARVESSSTALMPAMTAADGVARYNQLVHFVKQIMQKDKDFGVIPGTDKPTLLKPGAEKLCSFFGLAPDFINAGHVVDWDRGFFHYEYKCVLSRNGDTVGSAIGSANSREKRYRWRSIPVWKATEEDKRRATRKEERKGKGGRSFTFYIVENDDPFTLVNTLQKMAQKRALVAAVLIAANASEFFTQDVEDLEIIDAEIVDAETGEVSGGRNGHAKADAPDLSNTDDFLLLWDNACEGKGLDIPTGRMLLEAWSTRSDGAGLEECDAATRQQILDKLKAQSPASIEKIKQRAAQRKSVGGSPDSPRAGAAPSTAEVPSAAPAVSDPDPDVAGGQDEPPALEPELWNEFVENAWQLAREMVDDRPKFDEALKNALRAAGKVKTPTTTSAEWRRLEMDMVRKGIGHWTYLRK